jgi:hypothetical protein
MIYFIIIPSLILRSPKRSVSLDCPVTMLYTFCISPTCATFPAHPTILYLLIGILNEVYILEPHYAILGLNIFNVLRITRFMDFIYLIPEPPDTVAYFNFNL